MGTPNDLGQSANWDDVLPLSEVLKQAMFFILLKQSDSLAYAVMSQRTTGGREVYIYRALSHDREGIICNADGSIQVDYVGDLITVRRAELTKNPDEVIRYIWAVMNCQESEKGFFQP
jgi:hypothetical protein